MHISLCYELHFHCGKGEGSLLGRVAFAERERVGRICACIYLCVTDFTSTAGKEKVPF